MNPRMKYIQVVLESLIPLFGYFLWDWSLYFILLFYFIDMLADEGIMYLRSRAICSIQSVPLSLRWRYSVLSTLTLATGILLIHLTMGNLHDDISYKNEIIRFWTYEELGVQQGFLLVPLVVLAAYQNYRIGFLMTGRFKTLQFDQLWKEHLSANLIIIACAGIAFGLSFFIAMEDIYMVILVVTGIALYKLFWNRN